MLIYTCTFFLQDCTNPDEITSQLIGLVFIPKKDVLIVL